MPTSTSNFNFHGSVSKSKWFQELQAQAWNSFLKLPQPSRSDEMWRFANLKKASLEKFVEASKTSEVAEILRRSQGMNDVAAKFVFANDQLLHLEVEDLPQEVLCISIEEALAKHEELFRQYFMQYEARLGSQKFAMLHQAQLRTGAFLYLPPGVVLNKPIEIWHWVEGVHSAIFPHTLIVVGEHSYVSVLERFVSLSRTNLGVCYERPRCSRGGMFKLCLSPGVELSDNSISYQ
jgi:Fe-S cluster assembly protein SufD